MPNIADQLDAAIGAAPPPSAHMDATDAPLGATLDRGRRALRRRRMAYGIGATATALVIGGTAWAMAPGVGGSASDREHQLGNAPTGPSTTQSTDVGATTEPWPFGSDAAAPMEDGTVVAKPGWVIAERIDEPAGPGSIAVDVQRGDEHQWFLWSGAGRVHVARAPDPDFRSFDAWVAVNAPSMSPDDGAGDNPWPGIERDDLVRFSAPQLSGPEPGTLVPLHDTVIVEQRPGVDLGAAFAGPGDVTGVALVASEGSRSFVLARSVDEGPAQYIAVPTGLKMDTLEEFIAFAQERYAEGGGGLL